MSADMDPVRAVHVAAGAAFLAAARALPPAWRGRPGACGDWTAREVVCHSTGWEVEALARLRAVRADPATPARDYDDDAFNAASVAARRELAWDAALAELAEAHAALVAFLAALEPTEVARDPRLAEWADGRAADFAEHAAQLRAWMPGERTATRI